MKRLRRHIPEEIVILILQRLPPKSLLRFRCVQKSWYHLIQSPWFITAHANCQKKYLLVGSNHSRWSYFNSFSLSLRFDEAQCKEYYRIHQQSEEYYRIHPEEDHRFLSNVHWYAASHGLICYTCADLEHEFGVFLWNPAIRKIKSLPDPPERDGATAWITLAFGFSQKANDFKVVKILDNYQTIVVEVYSLNTHSWKTISNDNLIRTYRLSENNWVFLNGTAYIFGSSRKDFQPIIVSYDTDSDIMSEISTPHTWETHFFHIHRSIRVLNDSLVIFTGNPDECSFNMWVLQQGSDTNKFFWEKKINVDLGGLNSSCWDVFALRSNGELVLRESSENELVSYDAEKDEEKDFADSWDQWFESGRKLPLWIDSFSESLVLINT